MAREGNMQNEPEYLVPPRMLLRINEVTLMGQRNMKGLPLAKD